LNIKVGTNHTGDILAQRRSVLEHCLDTFLVERCQLITVTRTTVAIEDKDVQKATA
jgi:hypothetical protein